MHIESLLILVALAQLLFGELLPASLVLLILVEHLVPNVVLNDEGVPAWTHPIDMEIVHA